MIAKPYLLRTFFASPTFPDPSRVFSSRRAAILDVGVTRGGSVFSLITLPLIFCFSFVPGFIQRHRLRRLGERGPTRLPQMHRLFLKMTARNGRQRRHLPCVALLLLSLFLMSCSRNDGQPVLGLVFRVDGTAVASEKNKPDRSRSLSAGDQFSARDEVRVLAESSAALCLTPGIYLRCLGPSHLSIEELRVSKDGDEMGNAMKSRRAMIQLHEGRIHAFLPREGTAPCELKINTAAGTIVATAGSLFSVTLQGQSIRVLCLRGELNWSDGAMPATSILPGYYCDRKLSDNAVPNVLPASENVEAQNEVLMALDSAQNLDDLENAARRAPAPWRKR